MVKGMTRPRALTIATAALISLGVISSAAPAQAVPVPDAERYVTGGHFASHNGTNIIRSVHVYLRDRTPDDGSVDVAPDGLQTELTVSSCGRVLRTSSAPMPSTQSPHIVYLSPNGLDDASGVDNSVNRLVGPTIDYTMTITQPGYDPYQASGVIDIAKSISRPTCAEIDALVSDTPEPDRTNKPAWVRAWSKKISMPGVGTKPVAGSKAKVTATKVRRKDGAVVRYAWRVGNRIVDRDRTVRLTDAHIGKPLMLTVTARKPGTKAARLVLTYGKVRKAA